MVRINFFALEKLLGKEKLFRTMGQKELENQYIV